MILKEVEGLYVDQTYEGKIVLEQDSQYFGEPVHIYITLDQFRSLKKWVEEHELEIDAAWNGGVEDEVEDESEA